VSFSALVDTVVRCQEGHPAIKKPEPLILTGFHSKQAEEDNWGKLSNSTALENDRWNGHGNCRNAWKFL